MRALLAACRELTVSVVVLFIQWFKCLENQNVMRQDLNSELQLLFSLLALPLTEYQSASVVVILSYKLFLLG